MTTETTETGTVEANATAKPEEVTTEAPKTEVTTETVAAPSGAEIETPVVEDAATVLKEIEEAEAAPQKTEKEIGQNTNNADDLESKEASKEIDPKEPVEEKQPTASQLRRQKQRAAKEASEKKIADQQAYIEKLEADKKALEDSIVDTDTAENYDEATQTNAINKALGAQKTAEIDKAKTEKATIAKEAAIKARTDFATRGKEIEGVTDFETVVFKDDVPFTPDTVAALMEIDNGPEVAYNLATKPDELAKLNQMTPVMRAIELGKMSATYETPKPKIETKAPEPIKPTANAGSVTTGKPESEMSYAEMRASLGMNVDKPGYRDKT